MDPAELALADGGTADVSIHGVFPKYLRDHLSPLSTISVKPQCGAFWPLPLCHLVRGSSGHMKLATKSCVLACPMISTEPSGGIPNASSESTDCRAAPCRAKGTAR